MSCIKEELIGPCNGDPILTTDVALKGAFRFSFVAEENQKKKEAKWEREFNFKIKREKNNLMKIFSIEP